MMISTTKEFCQKTLPLVLIVFAVFTVSLTETIQISDGFSASAVKMIYELDVGEKQVIVWPISNTFEEPINLEFYATGPGSELLVFEKFVTIDPHVRTEFEIFVIVPQDHSDNVEYHPELFALKRSEGLAEGESGMIVNSQVRVNPIIKIGDNPIYTAPKVVEKTEIPKQVTVPIQEEIPKVETLDEKLARIQASNQANIPQVKVDDTWEETFEEEFEEEAVKDYVPEPIAVTPQPTMESVEPQSVSCDFIEWLLSLFGMSKC